MNGINGKADAYDGDAQIQLISGDQHFNGELPQFMKECRLYDAGFLYNLVAVFGSQSTGKSTLLNNLFGTQFDTMNEVRRQQTTKGIWMARAKDSHILVMDVEGTDGRERGDDQDFERKSALFSLATSEVIIVNMWENQVGLYNGANMGLLKTVFEVNLQLFPNKKVTERSLLLFVIRDHLGTTPLVNLANTLKADLERIWLSLRKPEGLDDCVIEDYFELDFGTLPHKILLPEKFIEETSSLRRRFVDEKNPNYLFKPKYHRHIPADGFPAYAEQIWEQIVANKDLDLPSQQQLLAQYRCDEISANAYSQFEENISVIESKLKGGKVLESLGPDFTTLLTSTSELFDTQASRYHKDVYHRKRDELLKKLFSRMYLLFNDQLSALKKEAMARFKKSTTATDAQQKGDFSERISLAKSDSIAYFETNAKSCLLQGTNWSYESELNVLTANIDELAAKLRSDEIKKLLLRIEKQLKQQVHEPVALSFNKPSADIWDRVLSIFEEAKNKSIQTYKQKSAALNTTEDEDKLTLAQLEKQAWIQLRSSISDELNDSHLMLRLREYFEEKFRYDEQGVPRIWTPSDDIDGKYTVARDDTLKLIPVLSTIKKSDGTEPEINVEPDDDFDNDSMIHVLSTSRQADVTNRFKKLADALYIEAKRSTISSVAKIPIWFWGLLLAFGWNEILAVLRSPLYFMTLVLAAALLYVVWYLNLWGPIEQVAGAMISQTIETSKEKLREALEVTNNSQPAPPYKESIELDNLAQRKDD